MSMCYYCMQDTVQNGKCHRCGRPVPSGNYNQQVKRHALREGTLLDKGNIQVGYVIGGGGFGITYIARDKQYGLLALKEFMPEQLVYPARDGLRIVPLPERRAMFEKSMRNFKRESKLLNSLHHPNIVPVYFDMEENGTAYYGMPMLQGMNLREWYKNRKNAPSPMSAQEVYQLLHPIMDALHFVHAHETLHRDVAPDNIFMRKMPDGQYMPCLIDFGAAYTEMSNFTATQSMLPVHKHGFSPPEQEMTMDIQGDYTDVYSMAAVMYFLMTGRVPPTADSVGRPRNNDTLKPPSAYNPSISAAVDAVLVRGLALSMQQRYQKMRQMDEALAAAVGIPVIPVSRHSTQHQPEPAPVPQPIHAPQPVPTPQPAYVSQPEPQPQQPEVQQKRPVRMLLALLLDALLAPAVCWMITQDVMYTLIAVAAMLFINTILMPPMHGTLMQRLLGTRLYGTNCTFTGWMYSFLYNLVRMAAAPIELIDELIACAASDKPATGLERWMGYSSRPLQMSEPAPQPVQQSYVQPAQPVQPEHAPQPPRMPSQTPKHSGHTARLIGTKGAMKGQTRVIEEAAVLGRGAVTIVLPDSDRRVSKVHCRIYWQNGQWMLEDLKSSNGTYVQQTRVQGSPCALKSGVSIQIGEMEFIFKEM